MNMVPGMVTTFWFTPTKAGRYDILCAQLCGIGHANMRGVVVVEDEAAFARWLAQQTTFEQRQKAKAPVSYTHLTLPTNTVTCRSRWSPYH